MTLLYLVVQIGEHVSSKVEFTVDPVSRTSYPNSHRIRAAMREDHSRRNRLAADILLPVGIDSKIAFVTIREDYGAWLPRLLALPPPFLLDRLGIQYQVIRIGVPEVVLHGVQIQQIASLVREDVNGFVLRTRCDRVNFDVRQPETLWNDAVVRPRIGHRFVLKDAHWERISQL